MRDDRPPWVKLLMDTFEYARALDRAATTISARRNGKSEATRVVTEAMLDAGQRVFVVRRAEGRTIGERRFRVKHLTLIVTRIFP